MSDILSEGLIAVPEHMFTQAMQNIASHVLSWALIKAKTKAQQNEVWRLADKYDCELWHEYTTNEPVKIDHLKLDFSDIPQHYPDKHHDDIFTAVDWRKNYTAAAWHKSKKVILVYPMSGPRPDLMYWPDREHALEDYLDDVETSVRHELRHAIQTILLPDAQNTHTYTDAVKDPVSYATSPNEFDPTIGTLADNFVRYYKALVGYGKKPDASKLIRQAVGMLPPNFGEQPDRFFKILRKEDPARYRLAVKKFAAEVMKIISK